MSYVSPRSPLSPRAGWPANGPAPDADLAPYTATGYGQQRGLDTLPGVQRASELPAPAPADPLELLRRAVRRFAPFAKLQAYVLLDEDGVQPAERTFHVRLYGPDVREAVKLKRVSIAEIERDGPKAWAKERRRTDVWRLVEDCQRLVGGCLDEDFEARLHRALDTCPVAVFEERAAQFRLEAIGQRAA